MAYVMTLVSSSLGYKIQHPCKLGSQLVYVTTLVSSSLMYKIQHPCKLNYKLDGVQINDCTVLFFNGAHQINAWGKDYKGDGGM